MLIPIGHEHDTTRRLPWASIVYVALCVVAYVVTLAPGSGSGAGERALQYFVEHPYLTLDTQLREAAWGESADDIVDQLRDQSGPRPSSGTRRTQQKKLDELTAAWHEEVKRSPIRKWGLVPADFSAVNLVTSIFMHAGLLHLIGNLLFMWMSGPPLEDVWGRPFFAAFYLVAGVIANFFWIARYPDSETPLVGASGAVAGLMGAFMVRFWSSRIKIFVIGGFLIGTFYAPAWLMLGLWFAREVVSSADHESSGGGVAYLVHVGGFAFGAAVAWAVRHFKYERRVLAPVIEQALGGTSNPVVEEAHELREQGRLDDAWKLLVEELRKRPDNLDAALVLWNLAIELRRPRDAVRPMLRTIEQEVALGEPMLAYSRWQEIESYLPSHPLPLELRLCLGEALLEEGYEDVASKLLAKTHEEIGPEVSTSLLQRLALATARLRNANAVPICQAAVRRPDASKEVRGELQKLVRQIQVFGTRPGETATAGTIEAAAPTPAPPAPSPTPAAAPPAAPPAPTPTPPAAPRADRPPVAMPVPVSGTPPPPQAPVTAAEIADHLRQVITAVPERLSADSITIKLRDNTLRKVSFQLIRAVSTAQISNSAPGASPFQVIDLLVAPPRGARVTVRFPGQAFDARNLVVGGSDRDQALTALIDRLLSHSGATALPDARTVRALPFASYPSLQEYEARLRNPAAAALAGFAPSTPANP